MCSLIELSSLISWLNHRYSLVSTSIRKTSLSVMVSKNECQNCDTYLWLYGYVPTYKQSEKSLAINPVAEVVALSNTTRKPTRFYTRIHIVIFLWGILEMSWRRGIISRQSWAVANYPEIRIENENISDVNLVKQIFIHRLNNAKRT